MAYIINCLRVETDPKLTISRREYKKLLYGDFRPVPVIHGYPIILL